MSRQSLQEALGLKHRNHFNQIYLIPALEAGLIEMTIPDKPRSSKQRYRLTPAGSEVLKRRGAVDAEDRGPPRQNRCGETRREPQLIANTKALPEAR